MNKVNRYEAITIDYPIHDETNRIKVKDKRILIIGNEDNQMISKKLLAKLSDFNTVEYCLFDYDVNKNDFESFFENNNNFDIILNMSAFLSNSNLNIRFNDWNNMCLYIYNSLFYSTKYNYENLKKGGSYIGITNIGSSFGIENGNVSNSCLGGIVSGFIKGLEKELRPLNCKVIDTGKKSKDNKIVDYIISEMGSFGDSIEIAYSKNMRKKVITIPAIDIHKSKKNKVNENDTILFTGGGRGITNKILLGLLDEYKCSAIITGRTEITNETYKILNMNSYELDEYKKEFMINKFALESNANPLSINNEFNRLLHSKELLENLQQLKNNGYAVTYVKCDFNNNDDVINLKNKLREKNINVTGIVNGAGLPSFGKVINKNEQLAEKVVTLKANSLFLLNKYFIDNKTKFVISMGSISGRFGMDGQTDYSAGADVIVKITNELKKIYPKCLFKVIGWPAWSDVGMAANEDVIKVQRDKRGLTYVDPKEGVSHFIDELNDEGKNSEYLYFGELGIENMPKGQLDFIDLKNYCYRNTFDRKNNILNRIKFPWISKVEKYSKNSIECTRKINPLVDKHLDEHIVKNDHVLAGVLHVEIGVEMCELFCDVNNIKGFSLDRIRNFKFNEFVKFHNKNPLVLKFKLSLIEKEDSRMVFKFKLLSDFTNSNNVVLITDRLHSSGEIVFSKKHDRVKKFDYKKYLLGNSKEIDLSKYYKVASNNIYFGDDFKLLTKVKLFSNDISIASLKEGYEGNILTDIKDCYSQINPIGIDNIGRIMLLNEFNNYSNSIVPINIISSIFFKKMEENMEYKIFCKKVFNNDDYVTYMALVMDSKNNLILEIPSMKLIKLEKNIPNNEIIK